MFRVISFFFEDISSINFDEKAYTNWLKNCVGDHKFQCGDISIIFCSDEYLLNINKEYLNHDYYTDIITFNYNESDIISGDLFISIPRITENAANFALSFTQEFKRVIIHGVLHLVGFNDKTESEKETMRSKEDFYINKIDDVD